MKETLLQYASYNVWANKLIIDVMLQLTDEQLDLELPGSFPTIRKMVLHCWGAEDIWLQRLLLAEHPVWKAADFTRSFSETCSEWQKSSNALLGFVRQQYQDASFEHVLQYYNMKKQPFKSKVRDVLIHVFNHATYHRGQLVTMLRQVGVTTIPTTDFIVFLR